MPRSVLLFALPALAFYVFVVVVPTVRGGVYAFTDWSGLRRDLNWIGFDNFVAVFTSAGSTRALAVTVILAVLITVVQNAIGLLLALGVNTRIKSRTVLRILLFAPAVLPTLVAGYVWRFILEPKGALNIGLESIGLGAWHQSWLGDPNLALLAVLIVVVWQFSGYSMVIFLAGLQSVPEEVLEAASMDGAGPMRRFFSVTLPLLAPAITVNLMLSIIGGLKLFDAVFVVTNGGPGNATQTIATLIYRDAFTYNEYGSSIAMGLLLMVLVAIISGFQYRGLSSQQRKADA